MNTDRDNFHDWARDKPETTFSGFDNPMRRTTPAHPSIRWGRLAFYGVLGIAAVVGLKLFAGM